MKRRYNLLISLVINCVIARIAIFVFGTNLYMDDDNILSWMTYGIITEPSSRTLYTHVILGWLYKNLFLLIPGFNWQTLVYYLFIVLSGTVGLYTIIKRGKKELIVLWFLFELVFFHDVYVNLTYSVVAGFLACQGYLVLFLNVEDEKKEKWLYIASGFILCISSMIRFDPFISTSGFAFVVWVICVVNDFKNSNDKKQHIKNYVYPFTTILGTCFLLFLFDKACYATGEWKEYMDRENVRSMITDENNAANCGDYDYLFEKTGVTRSRGVAVVDWRSNDPEILTTELLEKIVSTKDKYCYLTSPYVWNTFWSQWKSIFSIEVEIYFSLILLASVILVVKKLTPILLLIPFFLEIFYLAFIGRMDGETYPARAIYVVLMSLAMGSVILCSLNNTVDKASIGLSGSILLFLLASTVVAQYGKDFSINGLGMVDVDEVCEEYSFLGNGDKIYVCEYYVRTEVEDAFGAWQVPEAGFMEQTVVLGSWLVDHPNQNELQNSLGCQNPYRALFENDDVYYIRLNSTENDILNYLRDNYDERIDMEYIKEKGNFRVFKYSLE